MRLKLLAIEGLPLISPHIPSRSKIRTNTEYTVGNIGGSRIHDFRVLGLQ